MSPREGGPCMGEACKSRQGSGRCFGKNCMDLGSLCIRRMNRQAWIPSRPRTPVTLELGVGDGEEGLPGYAAEVLAQMRQRLPRGESRRGAWAAMLRKKGRARPQGAVGEEASTVCAGCGAWRTAACIAYATLPVPGGPASSAMAKSASWIRPCTGGSPRP